MLLERILSWVGTFSGQVAVVTGASSETARMTALSLARCGADVVVVSRRRAGLKALQATIRSYGRRAIAVAADISDATSAREALLRASRSWGKVDLLINYGETSAGSSLALDGVEELTRLNLLAATVMTRAALPFMCGQKDSTIINVAPPTERGYDGSWGGSLATKFALLGFTETLRGEIANTSLELSVVLPEGVANGRTAKSVPPGWIAAATVLAAKFRLAEITAPPGPTTVEELRSVAPRAAEAVSGWVGAAQRLARGTAANPGVSRRFPADQLRLAVH